MKTDFLKKLIDKEFESAARGNPEDYLLVHSFPGFWTICTLPKDCGSTYCVEEYAQCRALEEGVDVVLVKHGREYVHFNGDGRKSRTLYQEVSETG